MLKKTIKYVDLDGNQVAEDYYFNMNTIDLTRFIAKYSDYTNIGEVDDTSAQKAMTQYINRLVENRNTVKIIEFIEDLILSSYGTRPDGKHFIKPASQREEFSYSLAYAALFEELLTDEKKMEAFMSGIIEKSASGNGVTHSSATVVQ